MAEALYRKYRPQVFEDVVGQEPIERTLKNAIAQDKVSHAYLFCGPRGTGKTTTARLLAKALLCQSGPTPDPDGTCEDCELIAEGAHPDVYELDAASRTGVENVREEIISRVQFAPTRGRYKVYIIDEVHMLSTAAFNALLKTLEEPPSHVVFILCTTDPQKVPETIHSRCQRFDFRRIAPETMVSRLGAICMAEDVEFEGEALDLIAQRAEGGLRNALTSLEQIIAYEGGKVTLKGAEYLLGSIDSSDLAEIMAHVGSRDIASCFRWVAAYVETGADLAQFVRDMSEHVRNLYVMALVGDDAEIEVSETTRRQLASELQWFGADRASRLLGVLGDLTAELKTSSNPRLAFEIALTRMVRPDSDLTLEALAERIEALESGYSAVAHVVSEQPAAQQAAYVGARFIAPDPVSTAARPAEPEPVPEIEPIPGSAETSEPASAPASREAAPAGSAPLDALSNPAALQRIWQAALNAVKKEKQAYGVLFMGTKVRFDEAAGMVKVVFPAESAFAFNAVQKPDVQDALTDALRKAAGADVPFAYEQAGSTAAQPAARRESKAEPKPEPEFQPEPEPKPAFEPQPTPEPEPVPYDQVPYEDIPYEPVPYEDLGPSTPDTSTAPSPSDNASPDGVNDIEAMLQAGFGGNVVFSEVDE
ncbi:MAG: DNA polymerase III subunit gamma/tau [Eggerthellaceae bacterium]|nr:DNA polymerase III subunit gamma/tau [Eggerthellaceae bacterium]